MTLSADPITVLNLALSIAIFVLGCWGYEKRKNGAALCVGVAFGLFGVSHLLTLLGFGLSFGTVLIAVRTAAYLTVAFALYTVVGSSTTGHKMQHKSQIADSSEGVSPYRSRGLKDLETDGHASTSPKTFADVDLHVAGFECVRSGVEDGVSIYRKRKSAQP